jgi:magnesium-protoporphyrin IX monomethyl ester (oxidative) cyclase
MDILLLNPYYSQPLTYYSFYRPTAPLGLMYLSGYLKKHGLDSHIAELGIFDIESCIVKDRRVRFGASDSHIADLVSSKNPKIVGITCMYSIYYRDVAAIARTIKSINPGVKIILGGNHASSYWRSILKNDDIDVVVIGEGEETFLELCRKLLNREEFADIPGLAFRSQDRSIARTAPRPFIKNLDDVPFPAYEKVDFKRYLGEGNPFSMRPPAAGIVSSRGCPGECVYCTVGAVWGRSWRGRSPQNVTDEIEYISRNYGAKEFAFLDDSASVDKKRWVEICDEIYRRDLDIKWSTPNGIAHWTLTKDALDRMKRSGCYRITFGIESGDTETRKFLGKPYALEQAKELIQYANRIGLWTVCTNIIGFPYENMASIEKTIRFAKDCGTDFACFYLLMPQPTSRVYEYFKKEKLLDFDSLFEQDGFDEAKFEELNYVLNETGSDTLYFKKEELSRLQKRAYRSFFFYRALSYIFHPWRMARKIRSAEDLRYVLRLVAKGIEIFLRTINPQNRKSSDYLYAKTKTSIE